MTTLLGLILVLQAGGDGSAAPLPASLTFYDHLPAFGPETIQQPLEMAAHIVSCEDPLCKYLMALPRVEQRISSARREGNVLQCGAYMAELLNQALSDEGLAGHGSAPAGAPPRRPLPPWLLANYELLKAHFGEFISHELPTLKPKGEQQAAYGELAVYRAPGKEVWFDPARQQVVCATTPYVYRGANALDQNQASERAREWLAACNINVGGLILTSCSREERYGRPVWELKWIKYRGEVRLPSDTTLQLTTNGLLSSLLHVDLPVEVSTRPGIARERAMAIAAAHLPGQETALEVEDLYVWYDPNGRQRLLWAIYAQSGRERNTVVLDAHSGEILWVMAPSNMSPPSPQVREARRRMVARTRTQHAALAVLAVLWIGFIGVRWRRPRSPSGQ